MKKVIQQKYEERLNKIAQAWSYSGAVISMPQRRQLGVRLGAGHTRRFVRGISPDAILKYPEDSVLLYACCEFPHTVHSERGYVDEYIMLNKERDEVWLNLGDFVLVSEKQCNYYFVMMLADDYLYNNYRVWGYWTNVISAERARSGRKPVITSTDDVHVLFTKFEPIRYTRHSPSHLAGYEYNDYPKTVRIQSSHDCDDTFILSRPLFIYEQASPNFGWFVTPSKSTYLLEHIPMNLYLLLQLDPETNYYVYTNIGTMLVPHICDPRRRDYAEMKQLFSQKVKPAYILVGIYNLMAKGIAAHFISRYMHSVNDIVLFVFVKGGVTDDGIPVADVSKSGIVKFYYVPFFVERITPQLIKQFQNILSTVKYAEELRYKGVATHIKWNIPDYEIPRRAIVFPYRYPLGIFYEGYISTAHPISKLIRLSCYYIHDVPELKLCEIPTDGFVNEDELNL